MDPDRDPSPVTGVCREGCECTGGTVQHGDKCISLSACGCIVDGKLYEVSALFGQFWTIDPIFIYFHVDCFLLQELCVKKFRFFKQFQHLKVHVPISYNGCFLKMMHYLSLQRSSFQILVISLKPFGSMKELTCKWSLHAKKWFRFDI